MSWARKISTRLKWIFLLQLVIILFSLRHIWRPLSITLRAGRPYGTLRKLNDGQDRTRYGRLVYVSCNRQNMNNPFWAIIEKAKPTGFVWMGDIVYADLIGSQSQVIGWVLLNFLKRPKKTVNAVFRRTERLFPHAEIEGIRKAYQDVLDNPGYQRILALPSLSFVVGVWDDHDYGVNDGDKSYPLKDESKKLLLKFLNVSADDDRYRDDHPGVYSMHVHTVEGPNNSTHRISIYLLDLRYNKDPWGRNTGDFLGEKQWAWFEKCLRESTSDVHLIVSSIQVLPEKRMTESWDGFPAARIRLLNLIAETRVKNPFFLSGKLSANSHIQRSHISGDVHLGEAIHLNYTFGENKNEFVHFWEFTSSGMTHATRRTPYGFGIFSDFIMRWIMPGKQTWVDSNSYRAMYTGKNIGILDIHYDGANWIHKHLLVNSKAEIIYEKDFKFFQQKAENIPSP